MLRCLASDRMCFESTLTAIRIPGLDPSAKFVLIAITDCTRDGLAYPTMRYIRGITGYDERTVKGAVDRLIASGLLLDTKDRVGRNRTVKVFRVNLPPRPTANKRIRATSTTVAKPPCGPDGEQTSAIFSSPTKVPGFSNDRNNVERTPPEVMVNPVTETISPEDAYASSSPKARRSAFRKSKGGPLPEDWMPPSPLDLPPSTYEQIQGWSQKRWDEEADNFRDYCWSRSGEAAHRKNWNREWAQWVRQAIFGDKRNRRGVEHPDRCPGTTSKPPVRERDHEGRREQELRAAIEANLPGRECIERCAFAIDCLDPSTPFKTIGLKIFARPADKSIVDSLGPQLARNATDLGYEVRWYRVEDGRI